MVSAKPTTLKQAGPVASEGLEHLGELHPLLEQLGSVEGLVTLSAVAASLQRPRVESAATLALFLQAYRMEILLPWELPAIFRAHAHASRNETRELIALDQSLDGQRLLPDLIAASRRIGQSQLKRLRPLRDARVVQRYLQAVEAGQAQGWHTLVYGLTLAVYSLPVRQGLVHYARQTLRGFIYAAARSLQLAEADCRQLLEELEADLPGALEELLAPAAGGR